MKSALSVRRATPALLRFTRSFASVGTQDAAVHLQKGRTCAEGVSSNFSTTPLRQLSGAVNLMQAQRPGSFSSVRHYADAPAANPEEQDPLKRIFFNMMKRYKLFISELTKSKITLDPDDSEAVADYKATMDGVRKKVGVPSKTQKIAMIIEREAAAAPDVKTFFKCLPKLKARLGVKEEYDGDKMMLEAVEKVEKKIGRVLTRADKEGMGLLRKEFDVINKALGVSPNMLKDLEAELEVTFAKAELHHMKKEVVETIETHKKSQSRMAAACQAIVVSTSIPHVVQHSPRNPAVYSASGFSSSGCSSRVSHELASCLHECTIRCCRRQPVSYPLASTGEANMLQRQGGAYWLIKCVNVLCKRARS